MAELLFRRGTLADLFHQTDGTYDKAPLIDGALSFTTDEPAIYMDTATGRERIGDIKTFANAQEFYAYVTAHGDYLPTTALYYIVGSKQNSTDAKDKIGEVVYYNALLKWTGTAWIQINEKSDYSGELSQLTSDLSAAAALAAQNKKDIEAVGKEVDDLAKQHSDDVLAINNSIAGVAKDLTDHKTAYNTKMTELGNADTANATALSQHIAAYTTKVGELQNAIDGKQATITGAASSVVTANLGAETVVTTDANGKITNSTISVTKLGYLTDVTSNIQAQFNDITGQIGGINTVLGNMSTAIGTAKTEAVAEAKTETENQIKDLVGDAASYKTLGALEDAIQANAKDIADNKSAQEEINTSVNTSLTGIGTEIASLKAADTQLGKDIAAAQSAAVTEAVKQSDAKLDALKNGSTKTIKNLEDSLSELTQTVTNNNNAATQAIAAEKSRAEGEEAKIRGEFAAADAALETKITGAYESYVDTKLRAADAMVFKGVVSSLNDLPTTNVEAGWTYKVGANIEVNSTTTLYVGDLLIANDDQTSSAYPKTIGTTGETWSHISSGYEDDHDVHVEKNGDKVVIKNAAGETRGSIEIAASTNSNLTVTVSETAKDPASGVTDVKVALTMEWGTF